MHGDHLFPDTFECLFHGPHLIISCSRYIVRSLNLLFVLDQVTPAFLESTFLEATHTLTPKVNDTLFKVDSQTSNTNCDERPDVSSLRPHGDAR